MKDKGPFDPKVVIGLIVLGLATFAAMIAVIAYGGPEREQYREPEISQAQLLSPSAVGFKALVEMVSEVRQTHMVSDPRDLDYADLLVLALDANSRQDELERVLRVRRNRATLLVLPKWRTLPHPARPDWVRAIGTGAGNRVAASLGLRLSIAGVQFPGTYAASADPRFGAVMPVPLRPQVVVDGANLIPLLTLRNGAILLAQIEGRPHYILADPDMLNNHGIREPGRARAALALLDALNAPDAQTINFAAFADIVVTVEREQKSLLRLLIEPPFLAMTLALAVAALLAGLHGAIRFGRPRREARSIALGKAALVENSAGLIRLARREAQMGPAYAEFMQAEAARAVGAPPDLQGAALDAHLDKLTRAGPTFTELAANLAKARDRHAMAAAARALFQWKKDVIR